MHTRRFASFILGAWILGCLLMGYVSSQTYQSVERILSNPPGPVAKDMEDIGVDVTRMLLRYEASETNRFLSDAWGVLQLGLGLAFLISCALTSHRSKFLMIGSGVMLIVVAIQMFSLNPSIVQLGRSFDFLPLSAALKDREHQQSYQVWYTVAEFIKLLIGAALAGRLLFDRYAWQQKLAGTPKRVTRRRRRHSTSSDFDTGTSDVAPAARSASGTSAAGAAAAPIVEKDLVDEPHDSHVDG